LGNSAQVLKIKTVIDDFGNIYCRLSGNQSSSSVFFCAHLDTVEPGRSIRPIIKNGFIQSDQTTILAADNKVAVAAILFTVDQLIKNHISHRNLEIVLTRSEEIGNYGAINFDLNLLRADHGYCFDSCTPVGTIISASPFYERFDIKILGQAAHASLPEKANNVIYPLTDFIKNIPLGKLSRETLLNIGKINIGAVRNTVPGHALLEGEIRSFKEKQLETQKLLLIKQLTNTAKRYKVKVDNDFVRENTGYFHKNAQARSKIACLKKIFSLMNVAPSVQTNWGVSDANIFNHRGKLCINLGNGSEFTHSVKERISIKSVLNLHQFMLKLLT